ncbi:hypothetical protein QRO11_15005 [Paracidovorax citrulli]|uniref:Secreted protein n=2 Tax=Paracidovorax citrulli TaxID=80869 RepID=A1TN58_PARC0|nr:hypothetical protein [Paracidovorax citrulli]ABM32396.1 hypothetical protein Aave_1812 [Paracidovorax citrulli AAC00-1]ATG94586.1 hypothetical protein CQB05_11590 [Paracidovorax citrulli]MVT28486.1 hypothetical protein [Paracidovorax citrulli]MVT38664.1 hypothetical protein [Paracidovorax citrulli]PVY66611.1 hypothetical protein C8E08_4024 [Paracidovorax citrulli]
MHTPGPRARSRRFSSRLHRSFFRHCALVAALIAPAAVPAQPPSPPATAVHGDAAPPRHAALPPWPAEAASVDWRDAHAAVAAFPRGHADIAAWEARRGRHSAAGAPTATGAPEHTAHTSAMQRHGHGSGQGHRHGSDPIHGGTPAGGHQP